MILSVQKAFKILSILSDAQNAPVTLADISHKAGIPKPTCSHILETLCNDGYAIRVSQSEGYRLGPSIYYLTRYGRFDEELVSLCRPVMRWMEKKSHCTVILSVIQGNQRFIIDYADTEQRIFPDRSQIRIGDIYRTATGRAILSHMDRDSVKMIYEKFGNPPMGHWNEVTSYETLLEQLAIVREQKIVVTDLISTPTAPTAQEPQVEKNAIGYACPIFRKTSCIGALGIAFRPSGDAKKDEAAKHELCRVLLAGTKEIHRRLSYEYN